MPAIQGGVIYGPFPHIPFLLRAWWIPVVLFFIAAGLIIANGLLLLSPAFYAVWITLFPWVIPIGSFGVILGIILGLVILGGIVLYFLRFRVLAAFLVFPSAIVSLFIGGGFVVGLIIGVLAAMLVISSPRFA
jgi:hypothetical protein